ncbi:MAG TPA: hypothetical protein QGF02_03965 [Candidatus Babeliales bacterium]|nr:hypothetical protein [Candidatus Babeliales bacterium]
MNKIFSVVMLACLSHSVYGFNLNTLSGLQDAVEQIGAINNSTKLTLAQNDILGLKKDRKRGETLGGVIIDHFNQIVQDRQNRAAQQRKLIQASNARIKAERTRLDVLVMPGSKAKVGILKEQLDKLVKNNACVKGDDKKEGEDLVADLETLLKQLDK